jgi:hypothetical protein
MNVTTKIFLAAAIAAAAGSAATAQRRQNDEGTIYVRLGGGYSFGAGKVSESEMFPGYNLSEFRETSTNNASTKDDHTITRTNVSASLGKGISYDLGVGYMLNPYIGFELGARGLIGLDNTFESAKESKSTSTTSGSTTNSTSSEKTTEKVAYSGFALVPALRIVAPVGEMFSVYSRVGISLPLFGKVAYAYDNTRRSRSDGRSSSYSSSRAREYTSYFKLGYSSALGVEVALGEHFSLFGEVNGLVASFEAKKATLTKDTENSNGDVTDNLSSMEDWEKVVEYQKKYTYTKGSSSSKTPEQDVSFTVPASSVGVAVGVVLKF